MSGSLTNSSLSNPFQPVGTGGGGLELVSMDGPVVKVKISGPAKGVMTVRVAVSQKLREKFPGIAAVHLVVD